jgi:hypothetical protein
MYCSADNDCTELALNVRDGVSGESPSGEREHGLEKLVHEAGVDLFVAGHVHNYERMYDIAPWLNERTHYLSGKTTRSTHNPPACTYIVTAAPGNVERHQRFGMAAGAWDAERLLTYGWSKMTVHNGTHLHWQQIQTDSDFPQREIGKVVDDFWLVQEKHGRRPPADTWSSDEDPVGHRRVYYGSEERTTEKSLKLQVSTGPAVNAERQEAHAADRYKCERVARGYGPDSGDPPNNGATGVFKVACEDAALTRDFNTKGAWQTTREWSRPRIGDLAEADVFV